MAKTTISFNGTPEIKAMIERWAADEQRSVSNLMRTIIAREAQRRQQTQPAEQRPVIQPGH